MIAKCRGCPNNGDIPYPRLTTDSARLAAGKPLAISSTDPLAASGVVWTWDHYLLEPLSVPLRLDSPVSLPITVFLSVLAWVTATLGTQQSLSPMLDNDIRLAPRADRHALFTIPCSFRELPRPHAAVHPRPPSSFERLTRCRADLSTLSVRDTHFNHDLLRGTGVNHRVSSRNWSPLILSLLALPLFPSQLHTWNAYARICPASIPPAPTIVSLAGPSTSLTIRCPYAARSLSFTRHTSWEYGSYLSNRKPHV